MFKKAIAGGLALALLASAAAAQFNPIPNQTLSFASLQGVFTSIALGRGPTTKFTYVSPTGGITTATAVTVKAAIANKGIHVRSLHMSNSGAAGTEVSLNCGASGTSLYRGWIGATQSPVTVNFPFALDCTAGTLVEFQTVSGTTIAVRATIQGYTD